uniref:Protein phosphatase 1 regulatory subunit 35 C-terminal domain-containing protein n=1 Tax=Amphilophus citrinellus TaxID=61819 RepID=A0A3Q0SS45_AMPCI
MSFSTRDSPPPSPHRVPRPFSTSPSLTCCPELDLSVTLSPAPKNGQTRHRPHKLKQSEQSQLKHNPQGQLERKRNRQVCSKETVVSVIPEPHIEVSSDAPFQQRLRGERRSVASLHAPPQMMDKSWCLGHLVEPPAVTASQDLSCLERAELNTTLALKTKLQSLQESEFNSQRAVQETLRKSERTKNLINARATEVVNVSRSQILFTSLVSVDVQEDQLINQLLQEKLLLAPPSQCCGSRDTKGPSPIFFITSDLLRQKHLPPEEAPVSCKPRPSACPAHSVFDLYKRQQCWEATP